MKKFRDILSEVAQPKSAEEKRFKDQHTIELIKHPVALDSQFTGEIDGVTRKKRLADPADGADAAKYDQAYEIKDKPFKMPRNIDEEVEELDEISAKLARKAAAMSVAKGYEYGQGGDDDDELDRLDRKSDKAMAHVQKRQGAKGVRKVGRLANKAIFGRSRAFESVEELDEKAVSQAQQKLMGMALAYKRGEMDDASDEVKNLAKSMSMKDLEDFASTKHKGLPVKKEGVSFKALLDRLDEQTAVYEDADEEIPMMMRQLHFIGYAADEILEYLAIDGLDPEEWWQNKLANTFAMMKSLHAYVEGDKRMMGIGMDSYDNMSAGYYGEEVELEEATFKPSNLKLKSGETVKLSMQDAKVLNDMMKTLNDKNRKEMESTLMSNKKGFDEILAFAKEAM